jgi:hypothetical protein
LKQCLKELQWIIPVNYNSDTPSSETFRNNLCHNDNCRYKGKQKKTEETFISTVAHHKNRGMSIFPVKISM